jgi:type I site-specific restriction endonuclease
MVRRAHPQKEKVMNLKQQRINVEVGEKESEGIYSNLALITHSPSEFIIDFARVMPGIQKTKVYARIVMTPAHAKMLHTALEENIKKYEGQFGAIKIFGKEERDKGIGFQAQKGE